MSQNGWKKWEKKSGGARYAAYESRMVVIISDGKTAYVYLPTPVLKALGNPEYIDIFTRGSNIALFKGDATSKGYKVVRWEKNKTTSFPYISLAALVKLWNISPGVYDAHVEDDHVVFDTQQKPSKA